MIAVPTTPELAERETETVDHTRLRLLLVDDHVIVREGMRAVLEEENDLAVVGECGSGDEALAVCEQLAPDLVLLDLNMPGISPVDTIRGLKRLIPAVRVMVFTSFSDDELLRDTLDAGATGFLLKDALQDELLRAIRSVAAGLPYLAPAAQRQLMELLRRPATQRDRLTAREIEVLRLIAQGCANKVIAARLHLSEGTVKGYVSQILDKLGVQDRTQAALHAVREGLVDPP